MSKNKELFDPKKLGQITNNTYNKEKEEAKDNSTDSKFEESIYDEYSDFQEDCLSQVNEASAKKSKLQLKWKILALLVIASGLCSSFLIYQNTKSTKNQPKDTKNLKLENITNDSFFEEAQELTTSNSNTPTDPKINLSQSKTSNLEQDKVPVVPLYIQSNVDNVTTAQFEELLNQVNLLTQDLEQKNKQLTSLQEQISYLRNIQKTANQNAWQLSEVGYLLKVAQHKLVLENNVNVAIFALKDAEKILRNINNDNLKQLSIAIAQDIQFLSNLPKLDRSAVLTELFNLKNQAIKLPVRSISDPEALVLTSDIKDWQSNLEKSANDFLQKFVQVIPKNGEAFVLSDMDKFYLQQNLIAHLNLASLALASNQLELYKQNLEFISQKIMPMFDKKTLAVTVFNETLGKLQEQATPQPVENLTSLTLFNNLFSTTNPTAKP